MDAFKGVMLSLFCYGQMWIISWHQDVTNIQWAIWICDWSLYVGCVLVNKEMVLMIFATVYGNAIFKEALVIFVKREQCLKVEYCDWPAYPPQIVFSAIVVLML